LKDSFACKLLVVDIYAVAEADEQVGILLPPANPYPLIVSNGAAMNDLQQATTSCCCLHKFIDSPSRTL